MLGRVLSIRLLTGLLALVAILASAPPSFAAADPGLANARQRSLVVVRLTFAAGAADPAPPSAIQAVFNGSAASVNAFYAQQTAGSLRFAGLTSAAIDVLPATGAPLVVPQPASCDGLQANLQQAVTQAYGSALSAYDHVMVVFPHLDCQQWAGWGLQPGRWTWINGSGALASARVLAHELGHNFGAGHASTWECTDAAGARVALSAACSLGAEYGDPFDVMGSTGATRLLSSYNRARTGELASSAVTTASAGEHVLSDANAFLETGTKLIMVPRPSATGATPEFFAVELRGPASPFDSWAATAAPATGLTIRLVPAVTGRASSKLLDMTPGTPTYDDAPLGEQRTFNDPVSGVRISLVSRQGRTAVVRVAGDAPVDTIAPAFAPGGLRASVRGAQVVVSWTAATDAYGVDHYEVLRDDIKVASQTGTVFTDVLPAGTDRAVYDVRAVDAAGNAALAGAVTATVTPTAPPIAPDVTGKVRPTTPDAPGSAQPAPTKPAVKVALPAANKLVLASPGFVGRQAVLPRSRILKFAAPGAGQLVVTVNGRRVAKVSGAKATVRLTRSAGARGRVTVVATGGQLGTAQRLTLKVRRGVVTPG